MAVLSISQLYSQLNAEYSLGRPKALHVFVLLSKIEPSQLNEAARFVGIGFESRSYAEDFFEVTLRLKTRFTLGYLIVRSNVWMLLIRPFESSVIAGQVATNWIEKMYPMLSRIYVEPKQILDILDSLNKDAKQLGLRGYYVVERGKISRKTWPRGLYSREELEEDIRDNLLDSLRFRFESGRALIESWVSRNGHLVFYRGGEAGFSDFDRLVLQPYIELGVANYDRFRGHERKIVGEEIQVRPFIIYPRRRLERSDLQALKRDLQHEYSTSVLYGGNPWLQMGLIDRGDGSNFDLYAYEDEIIVIPFNSVSPESLTRLYSLVQARFPSATHK
jgi:hypothetical protein